jgi:hypothetical protein
MGIIGKISIISINILKKNKNIIKNIKGIDDFDLIKSSNFISFYNNDM